MANGGIATNEEVVKLGKTKLGEDHPNTLRSTNSLAIRYIEAGRLDEAIQLTEEVVKLRKSKLGEDTLTRRGGDLMQP